MTKADCTLLYGLLMPKGVMVCVLGALLRHVQTCSSVKCRLLAGYNAFSPVLLHALVHDTVERHIVGQILILLCSIIAYTVPVPRIDLSSRACGLLL